MASKTLTLAATLTILAAASTANAGSSGTADTPCGYSSGQWNVPKGALVSSQGFGPVRDVVVAVGEKRSHSMLSLGDQVGHASMFSPGSTGWPDYCSTPLKANELQNGFPGAERVNLGGIYTYIYKNGTNYFLKYQPATNACVGIAAADYLLNSAPTVTSNGVTRYKNYTNNPINYSLYGFKDIEGATINGYSRNNGMVCSAFVAWAQYVSGGGSVKPYRYTQSQKANAINSLRNGVEDSCGSGIGFWGGVGAAITCFEGICDDAGRQVANCMAASQCNTDNENVYKSVRDNTSILPYAVSPDRVAGYLNDSASGHAGSSSAWENEAQYQVEWNQPGGNVYGCWF